VLLYLPEVEVWLDPRLAAGVRIDNVPDEAAGRLLLFIHGQAGGLNVYATRDFPTLPETHKHATALAERIQRALTGPVNATSVQEPTDDSPQVVLH
jgi:hypothetical protein